MASKPVQDYGYHDDRFEVVITDSFHCPICLNVLREPKMCRLNEHLFCHACIAEHLHNSPTCPQCMEELTPETLLRPSKSFMRCHSELKINCDYSVRGCPKYVELGDLNIHTKSCGFAPTKCSNEACGMLVDKRDKLYHEAELCQYRKREKCCDFQKEKSKGDHLANKDAELVVKTKKKQPKSKAVKNDVNGYKQNSSTGPAHIPANKIPAQHQKQGTQAASNLTSGKQLQQVYYNEPDNSVAHHHEQDDHLDDYDEPNYHVDCYDEPDDDVEDYGGPLDTVDDYYRPDNFEHYDGSDNIVDDYDEPENFADDYDGPDNIVDDYDEAANIVDDYDEPDNIVDDYDGPDNFADDYDEAANIVDEYDEPRNIVDEYDEPDNIVGDYYEPDNIVDDYYESDNIVDDYYEPDNIVDDYDGQVNIVDGDGPANIVDEYYGPDNFADDYDGPDDIADDYYGAYDYDGPDYY